MNKIKTLRKHGIKLFDLLPNRIYHTKLKLNFGVDSYINNIDYKLNKIHEEDDVKKAFYASIVFIFFIGFFLFLSLLILNLLTPQFILITLFVIYPITIYIFNILFNYLLGWNFNFIVTSKKMHDYYENGFTNIYSSYFNLKYGKYFEDETRIILVNMTVFYLYNQSKYTNDFFLELKAIQDEISIVHNKKIQTSIFKGKIGIYYKFYLKMTKSLDDIDIKSLNDFSFKLNMLDCLDYILVAKSNLAIKYKYIDETKHNFLINEINTLEQEINLNGNVDIYDEKYNSLYFKIDELILRIKNF